ncbi:hypothetical protein ACA910_021558 [Epithemia clementina (nom. ined.)]
MTTTTTTTAPTSSISGHDDSTLSLRIACLLPSATDICVALGLSDVIVGVTHECELPNPSWAILTQDGLDANQKTQAEIHEQVVLNSRSSEANSSCSIIDSTKEMVESATATEQGQPVAPSLYPIVRHAWIQARPNLVITQDLCHVCAPSSATVRSIIQSSTMATTTTSDQERENNNEGSTSKANNDIQILSLSPQSLPDVADTFVAVANACHVPERGIQLRQDFLDQLQALQSTIQQHTTSINLSKVLILEWLDPPFDAGHWMWDMVDHAVAKRVELKPTTATATPTNSTSEGEQQQQEQPPSYHRKSKQVSWSEIQRADPDVVIVVGCGFDLERNVQDARLCKYLPTLRATQQGRLYCVNANQYFVRPGPSLLLGTVLLALCVHDNNPQIVQAIHNLPFVPTEQDLSHQQTHVKLNLVEGDRTVAPSSSTPKDAPSQEDFHKLHEQACQNMEDFYIDPATGYSVFTQVAHEKRGKCCGSGCRHCPYGHENLKDKSRIQQPSILVQSSSDKNNNNAGELLHTKHGNLRVLFFSGGKDSFLAIRAVVRQRQQGSATQQKPFGLVLLTTYDATSRIIAHQDISIDTVIRQATHLGLCLVGVPMHRGSSESYVSRIQLALETMERQWSPSAAAAPSDDPTTTTKQAHRAIEALVFGDLHLEHVLSWRKEQLGPLGYRLEFPLLHVDYGDLKEDLIASQVKCVVSSSTVAPQVQVGEIYGRDLIERLETLALASTTKSSQELETRKGRTEISSSGSRDTKDLTPRPPKRASNSTTTTAIDVFGECGEFHTEVEVWETDPAVALGLSS